MHLAVTVQCLVEEYTFGNNKAQLFALSIAKAMATNNQE